MMIDDWQDGGYYPDFRCNCCDQPPVTTEGGGLCWEHFAELEAICWLGRSKQGQDSPHLHIHQPN